MVRHSHKDLIEARFIRGRIGGVTYQLSYAMHHNDANSMTSHPYYMRHFDKIDSALKDRSKVLDNKKGRLHI